VVEGSQLGGRVLLRRLRDVGVPHSLRYLEGRGAASGSHWTEFLTALREALASPQAIACACDGARWAFDILLTRYRRLGLLP
jgi:heme oxygenase